MEILALSLCLIAYNVMLNLLHARVQSFAYVPLNLLVTALLLVWAHRAVGLSIEQIGLGDQSMLSSALWGILTGILIGGLIFTLITIYKPRFPLEITQNLQFFGMLSLLYRITIYIPLGTVLLEEIAFRGILLQLFSQISVANQAIILQSAVFTFWHIGLLLRVPLVVKLALTEKLAFVSIAIAIFISGGLFGFLRIHTSSLVGPMLAHWLVNAITTIALWRIHFSTTH